MEAGRLGLHGGSGGGQSRSRRLLAQGGAEGARCLLWLLLELLLLLLKLLLELLRHSRHRGCRCSNILLGSLTKACELRLKLAGRLRGLQAWISSVLLLQGRLLTEASRLRSKWTWLLQLWLTSSCAKLIAILRLPWALAVPAQKRVGIRVHDVVER